MIENVQETGKDRLESFLTRSNFCEFLVTEFFNSHGVSQPWHTKSSAICGLIMRTHPHSNRRGARAHRRGLMFSVTAEIYDAIYAFKDYAGETLKIRQLIERERPSAKTILDVACGTGEHARFLSADFDVDGIDFEPKFIEIARAKNPTGNFSVADMRAFQLDQRYDVVQCLFSSIGYLLTPDDIIAALTCFRGHLAPGGVILVEPWLSPAAFRPGQPHMVTVDKPDLKVCRMNVSKQEGEVSILHFHYLIGTKEGVRKAEEVHRLALVPTDQMVSYFKAAGLRCVFDEVGLFDRGLFIARPLDHARLIGS
jgi:trans-aconitate methyltransferase